MNDPDQSPRPDVPPSLVQNLVRTRIPTRHGEFFLYYYNNALEEKEHLAIVHGAVEGQRDVPVRLHSECLTGDVFGSLRCDCGDQLDRALRMIGQDPGGVLLYLRQEGRGIGLLKKLQAYNLQDEGLDTVEANIRLGHLSDERDYSIAAAILRDLKIESVRLITNNPAKIEQLRKLGVNVSGRISIEIPFNAENEGYLRTKARKMQHMLSFKVRQSPNGEFAFIDPLLKRLDDHVQSHARRPFVSVAPVLTLDGRIVRPTAFPEIVSSRARRLREYLQVRHDAVISMPNTAGTELAVGIRRVEVDWHGLGVTATPLASCLFITTTDAAFAGVEVVNVAADAEGHPDMPSVLAALAERGLRAVLVEGALARIFLLRHWADYAVITQVCQLGLAAEQTTPEILPTEAPESSLILSHCLHHCLDRDIVIHGALR